MDFNDNIGACFGTKRAADTLVRIRTGGRAISFAIESVRQGYDLFGANNGTKFAAFAPLFIEYGFWHEIIPPFPLSFVAQSVGYDSRFILEDFDNGIIFGRPQQ